MRYIRNIARKVFIISFVLTILLLQSKNVFAADITQNIKEQIHFGENGVSIASGNYSKSFTDIVATNNGFTINIGRTYNSKDDRTVSYMGRGWSFNYEGTIKDDTNNSSYKIIKLGDGSAYAFLKNADGTFTANDSRNLLIKQADNTFVMTTKDQMKYIFNTNGFLSTIKDRNDNALTIQVDSVGKIQKIIDASGNEYIFTYNAQNYIYTIKDPIGRIVTYNYLSNLLDNVIDTISKKTTYVYDGSNYLTKIKESTIDRKEFYTTLIENDQTVVETIVYDHNAGVDQHKVRTITDVFGNIYTYAYDTTNRKTTITDKNNRQIIKWYDNYLYTYKSQDPEGKLTTIEYYLDASSINKFGEEKTITDRNGNKTIYARDNNGNITTITNADGSTKVYTYDDKNNLLSEKDELGKFSYYFYDSNKINLIKKVQPLNGIDTYADGMDESKFAITTYIYYSPNECSQLGYNIKLPLKNIIDPEGNITTYTYDENGNVIAVKDQEDKTSTSTFNEVGQKTFEVSPTGHKTDYKYNSNGQLEKVIQDNGETTRFVYDTLGEKIKEVSPNLYNPSLEDTTNKTYAGDVGTRYIYYNNGKVYKLIDAENNITKYSYDIYGNIDLETKPDYSGYKYEYDVMNRLKKVSFYENVSDYTSVNIEEYSYSILPDGKTQKINTKYINDTDILVTTYIYDFAGKLISQQNPDNTKILTSYNASGNLNTTTDAKGNITYYKYDGLNRPTEKWTPFEKVNGVTKYTYSKIDYDKASRKISEKSSKNSTQLYVFTDEISTNYTYYKNGKVKTITDSSGKKTVYTYDENNNVIKEEIYKDATNKNVTEYLYNNINKPIQKKVYINNGDLFGNNIDSTKPTAIITKFTYDKNGNLKTVKTPDGVITTYSYDNLNRQTGESKPGKDEYDNNITISKSIIYDFEGKILEKSDENKVTYSYNKRGFLETITDAKTYITAYYYDRLGRKIAEVSPKYYDSQKVLEEMNRIEYTFDKMGRVKTKINIYQEPNNLYSNWVKVKRAYKYDENGNLIKELEPLGFEAGYGKNVDNIIESGYGTEYKYNLANKITSVLDAQSKENGQTYSTMFEYDGLGRKTADINAKGVITKYYYDDSGNLLSIKVKKSANDVEQVLKSSTYDFAGNQLSTTDGNGNTTKYEYNILNKLRKVIYPIDSTMISSASMPQYIAMPPYNTIPPYITMPPYTSTSPTSNPVSSNIVTYQYDTMGNVKKMQNGVGTVTVYTYNNNGKVLTQTEQNEKGKDAIKVSFMYDKNGNKRFETDGNGTKKEYIYNELNKLISTKIYVTNVNNQTTLYETRYDYDANGNQTIVADWKGNALTNVYDPLNRLTEKRDVYYGIIRDGQKFQQKAIQILEYNSNSVQISSTDAMGNTTKYLYDLNNRLIQTKDQGQHVTSQTYDEVGNISSKTDGNGNITIYIYDELNRAISVTNPKGEATRYIYDLNGNIIIQTDSSDSTVTVEYNSMNKPVKRMDNGGKLANGDDPSRTESYTYYYDGKLRTKTDRNGNINYYIYDIHGNLIKQEVGTTRITYSYDKNGNQTNVTNSAGSLTRTYDQLNRVKTKTVSNVGTSTFIYDGSGLTTDTWSEITTDPKGNITTKYFDKVGRMIVVIADNQSTKYEYYDNGSKKSVIYPDKSREEYVYNNDGLLETLTNYKADGTGINSYLYKYDAAHNQIEKIDYVGTTKYNYDELNRLETVTEVGKTITTYAYDAAGNRIQEIVAKDSIYSPGVNSLTNYTYNDQNRLLQSVVILVNGDKETTTYKYDNNGNMIFKTKEVSKKADLTKKPTFGIFQVGGSSTTDIALSTAIYEYDELNQLIKSKSGSQTVVNGYNGEGTRVSKEVNGLLTRYMYEYDKVVLEVDKDGKQIARNVYGTNLISRQVAGDKLYYMYNGHADVVALINSSGTIVATYNYDAFGNITSQTGTVNNNITYAGYQYDKETGLYYLMSRMYDPKIARFIQNDSYRGDVKDPLSLNLYTYCHNEPLIYYDYDGHKEACDSKLSKADQTRITTLTNNYNSAQAKGDTKAMDDAHRAAVAIRTASNSGIKNYVDTYNYSTKAPVSTKSTSYSQGLSGSAVGKIQQSLVNKGFSVGSSGVDNDFGTDTKAAVVRFQIDNGLVYDGIVGTSTQKNLGINIMPVKPSVNTPNVSLITRDLGKGWWEREERNKSGSNPQKHVHVGKDGLGEWSQNEDGTVHDEGTSNEGDPPQWIKDKLKDKARWSWDDNKEKLQSQPQKTTVQQVSQDTTQTQPSRMYQIGQNLQVLGGAIVGTTLVEDVATFGAGILDDVVTIPAGGITWGIGKTITVFAH